MNDATGTHRLNIRTDSGSFLFTSVTNQLQGFQAAASAACLGTSSAQFRSVLAQKRFSVSPNDHKSFHRNNNSNMHCQRPEPPRKAKKTEWKATPWRSRRWMRDVACKLVSMLDPQENRIRELLQSYLDLSQTVTAQQFPGGDIIESKNLATIKLWHRVRCRVW